MRRSPIFLLLYLLLATVPPAHARGASAAPPQEGDFVVSDFSFASGETLPELRLHYRTLGTPHRDRGGRITNAVMILHGTSGSGRNFLAPQFAGELFGPGQLLDAARYYIILPDAIGHGGSSKPSDGLRMAFPRYDYDDMVEAQRRLLVDGLGIDRLRLLIGTSMGCMHAFVWGARHPDFARALLPLACLPAPVAGLNRVWRKAAMDGIRADPAWNGGNYAAQPELGVRAAAGIMLVMSAAPRRLWSELPAPAAADEYAERQLARIMSSIEANDLLYQLDSSRNYDPSAGLRSIRAPLTLINSADDLVNPHDLGVARQAIGRIPHGRFHLIPGSPETHGHGTHSWVRFWRSHLARLLARSGN